MRYSHDKVVSELPVRQAKSSNVGPNIATQMPKFQKTMQYKMVSGTFCRLVWNSFKNL